MFKDRFTSYLITNKPEGLNFNYNDIIEYPLENNNTFNIDDYIIEESLINNPIKTSISTNPIKIKTSNINQDVKNMSFETLLNKIGANARITSSFRKGAKTKQGRLSWHAVEGGAYDIVPNDGDFNRLRRILTTHPLSIAWFKEHDKGILDETTKEMLARTGGTDDHIHIGSDEIAERFWKAVKAKSGIKIKKENKGKFTDYCGGKVTNECILKGKNSSSSTIRKRATFAANVRKWKHKEGGKLINKFSDGGMTSLLPLSLIVIAPVYSQLDVMEYEHPEIKQAQDNYKKEMNKASLELVSELIKVLDPTGISSYKDVYDSYNQMISSGFDPLDITMFAVNLIGALPVIGKVTKIPSASAKVMKIAARSKNYSKKLAKLTEITSKIERGTNVIPNAIGTKKATQLIQNLFNTNRIGNILLKGKSGERDINNLLKLNTTVNILNTANGVQDLWDAATGVYDFTQYLNNQNNENR